MKKCAVDEDLKEFLRREHERDIADNADFAMLERAKKDRDGCLVGALINAIGEKTSNMHISANATTITDLILERYFGSPNDNLCQELLSDECAIDILKNS